MLGWKPGRMRSLIWILLFALCFCDGAFSECPDTEDWQPPDLESATAEEPWLLVLRTAQGEIGYTEGPGKNQTKYGEWFGEKRAQWCTEFVVWCAAETDKLYGTELLNSVYPFVAASTTMAKWYMDQGRFISSSGKLPTGERQWMIGSEEYIGSDGYLPEPGDVMFECWLQWGRCDHTSLVEGVSDDGDGTYTVHVIEGNNPDAVARNAYPLEKKGIYGFATPVRRARRNLRLYNKGEDVRQVFEWLESAGYDTGKRSAKSEFTVQLRSAVRQWQRDHGLPVSGIVDCGTWLSLEREGREHDGE